MRGNRASSFEDRPGSRSGDGVRQGAEVHLAVHREAETAEQHREVRAEHRRDEDASTVDAERHARDDEHFPTPDTHGRKAGPCGD